MTSDKAAAIAEAERLEKLAAELCRQAHEHLRVAHAMRRKHEGWLMAGLHQASAEVECWSPERRLEYRYCYDGRDA